MTKFTSVDGLTLHNRYKGEGRDVPFVSVDYDRTQLMLFGEAFATNCGDLKLGVFANVPHTGTKPAIMYAAIQKVSNGSFIILPDKDSTVKTEINTADPLDWIYTSIKSSVEHINVTLTEWLTKRWSQLHLATASLEECLDVAKRVGPRVLSAIDLDSILTAHKMASPSDKWPMYRKQANTPYSRLDLISILAEYATFVSVDMKFKIMADAGSMIVQYGDLELRPTWINWNKIDYSNTPRIL